MNSLWFVHRLSKATTASLDIMTRVYGGDNHLDVAKSYNGLGKVYDMLGQYEQACRPRMRPRLPRCGGVLHGPWLRV